MRNGKISTAPVIKIVVPVVVAALVAGVFFLKRSQNSAQAAAAVPAVSQLADLHVVTPIDYNALRSSGLPVIIDFGADSCVPCKEMAPVLAELNESLQGKAIILFVDVWKYKNLAEGVPLRVIPTQVFFDSSGKPFSPQEALKIEFVMYSARDTKEHVFTTHEGGLDKPQMLAILNAMGMK
jgi:thioredoxin 1